jgi:hypothetical protein
MDVAYKNAATERPVTGFAVLVSAVRKQIYSPFFDKLDKFFTAMVCHHMSFKISERVNVQDFHIRVRRWKGL